MSCARACVSQTLSGVAKEHETFEGPRLSRKILCVTQQPRSFTRLHACIHLLECLRDRPNEIVVCGTRGTPGWL